MSDGNGTEQAEQTEQMAQVGLDVLIQVGQQSDGVVIVNMRAARPLTAAEVLGLLEIAKHKIIAQSTEPVARRPNITVVRGGIPKDLA